MHNAVKSCMHSITLAESEGGVNKKKRNWFDLKQNLGLFLHLSKLDSTSPKECLCYKVGWNWLSGSWEDNFKFVNVFSLFRFYLPFEMVVALHLTKLESVSLHCPCLVEISRVVLERKMEMWKVYRQTNRRTDDRRPWKLTWAFNSGELKYS